MKLRKQVVGKVILGAVLIVLAGLVAYAVKDLLAYRNPESSLPVIRINYNGTELPAENWTLESYSWNFLTLTRDWQAEEDAVEKIPPAPVVTGAPLDISFSFEPSALMVSRAKGGGEFIEQQGDLHTPSEQGEYTYRIEGDWGIRGRISYYFKIYVI